jgi:sigma-B regulation protein RsbU (phosphoserine phosphatase)
MNKKIMIIEDDFETQFLFSELLESEGYDVVPKTSGKEALEYIDKGGKADLIFMDLNFPGGTPEEFTARLRSSPGLEDVPVILISGKSDIADYAKRLNARSYIKKPFDLDPLLDLLHEVL